MMSDDDLIGAHEALLAAFDPGRALLSLSHAVRTRTRYDPRSGTPVSVGFRVFRGEESQEVRHE